MFRKIPPKDTELERLLEERDHLKIQISLSAERQDADELERARSELGHIEGVISARQRTPQNTGGS